MYKCVHRGPSASDSIVLTGVNDHLCVEDVTLSLMEKVQNTAARMVLNKHQSYSATECLKQLLWLPIKLRIEYKVLTIVFKSKYGMVPKYLQDLLESKEHHRQRLKSNNKEEWLKEPTTARKKHLQIDHLVSKDPSFGTIYQTT